MRDLSEDFDEQLFAKVKTPVVFLEGEFNGGSGEDSVYVERLWSGPAPIEWDGKTWLGAGGLLSVSPAGETSELRAAQFAVGLSGIPVDRIARVLGAVRKNKPGRVWFGFLMNDGSIVSDPQLWFEGRLDVPEISEDGPTATVTFTYANRLVVFENSITWRLTNESQQTLYPGDRGFEFVTELQEWNGLWGRS
ncbi:MAG: hypothetical protein WD407_04455 [Rhodospirillales bacterium]